MSLSALIYLPDKQLKTEIVYVFDKIISLKIQNAYEKKFDSLVFFFFNFTID